ncbi:MAG: hypothetical protein FJY85_08955 [Deltaproteobacteria bacterium]|nr:hypothetical protein [Deltaproteobacteria bacterium]
MNAEICVPEGSAVYVPIPVVRIKPMRREDVYGPAVMEFCISDCQMVGRQ